MEERSVAWNQVYGTGNLIFKSRMPFPYILSHNQSPETIVAQLLKHETVLKGFS
jgi:hypothetical protein